MKFNLPLTEADIKQMKAGDIVELTGVIYTARDAAHKYIHEGGEMPVDLKNATIYHCGPITKNSDGKWEVLAAGPTTSIREEPYTADLIERLGWKAIIGKGGMAEKTAAACQKFGAVYLNSYGGCAQFLADKIVAVNDVYFYDEFGAPEAIWELEVKDFPAIVTMDSYGVNLHRKVEEESNEISEKWKR